MSGYDFLYDLPREDFCGRGLHYLPRIQYGREHPRQFMECIFKDDRSNMPILIWVHGGAWKNDHLTTTYRPEKILAELAEKGYFIACIEYRLSQHEPFPACVLDCQTAIKYIKFHAEELKVDPNKIAVWGESAGAHIASMVGMNFNDAPEALVQAVIAWYCPSNFTAQLEETDTNGRNIISMLIGCDASTNEEKVRAASPLSYAAKKTPPFLLMHGDVDKLVPYSQSVELYHTMKDAGNDVRLITVPGHGHGFFKGEAYYEEIKNFLQEKLQQENLDTKQI